MTNPKYWDEVLNALEEQDERAAVLDGQLPSSLRRPPEDAMLQLSAGLEAVRKEAPKRGYHPAPETRDYPSFVLTRRLLEA
ncbi:MAG TPA: hypothetical protein VHA30_00510 [Patescibacteria group bacterium]|nr:hypothetical protein [Patescibacteria group bacterium]